MESFIIEGGHPLQGTIYPQGAKNEALEVICTTILTDEPVRINNVPDILDVNNLIKLLKEIGVKVTQHNRHDYTFQSDELNLDYLDSLEFVKKCSSLRGSVLMFGPLLGRCGKATIAKPGGDRLVVAVSIPISWVSSIWVLPSSMTRSAMCIRFRQRSSRAAICCSMRLP